MVTKFLNKDAVNIEEWFRWYESSRIIICLSCHSITEPRCGYIYQQCIQRENLYHKNPRCTINSRLNRNSHIESHRIYMWKVYLNTCGINWKLYVHDGVIKWKHFPRNWPFVQGIHRSPVNSPHKGQWRGALMFSLICARINGWVNNGEAGDLRRYRVHCDVIVLMISHVSALSLVLIH